MKKLFCAFIMSFIIMFFIWTMVAWITIPDFVENASDYHLDLYSMFYRFSGNKYISKSFISLFQDFIKSMEKLNTASPLYKSLQSTFFKGVQERASFKVLITLLNSLISPFYSIVNVIVTLGYFSTLIIQFLVITTDLANAIFDFVFNPIFIKI